MTLPFPKTFTLDQAVHFTLSYFDLFEVPLSQEQLEAQLLNLKSRDTSEILKKSRDIYENNGRYALRDIFERFSEKEKRSHEYWKKIYRYRWLFNLCPFVEAVFICNSLPINDIHQDSDIDLLVVAQKGQLYTARFFLTLFTQLLGIRRHGSKIKKRFCLSFYVTEDALNFSSLAKNPFDIYLAYWIKTLELVAGDPRFLNKIHDENQVWLKSYFYFWKGTKKHFQKRSLLQRLIKSTLEFFLKFLQFEKKTKKRQLKSILKKRAELKDPSGTVANDQVLKFHDQDRRNQLNQEWLKKIQKWL